MSLNPSRAFVALAVLAGLAADDPTKPADLAVGSRVLFKTTEANAKALPDKPVDELPSLFLTVKELDGERALIAGLQGEIGWVSRSDLIRFEEAEGFFSERIREKPDPYSYRARNFARLLDRRDPSMTEERRRRMFADLNEALALFPEEVGLLRMRAAEWQSRGELDRAIADCTEVLRLRPEPSQTRASTTFARATLYARKGDLERAVSDLDESIRIRPEAFLFVERGRIKDRLGKPDLALVDFDEAIRLNPNFARARVQRGSLLRGRKERVRAMADFDEAVRIDPKSIPAYAERAKLWFESGEYDRVIADCDAILRLRPRDAWARLTRGKVRYSRSDYVRALWDLRAAKRLDPAGFDALVPLADCLNLLARPEEALGLIDEAIRRDPSDAYAHNRRALALAKLLKPDRRDPAEAVKAARRACDLIAGNAGYFFATLAMAQREAGDLKGAAASAEESLRQLSPNDARRPEIEASLRHYRSGRAGVAPPPFWVGPPMTSPRWALALYYL